MLGRYGAQIGFYRALLVVVAVAAGRLIWTMMTSIQPNDIGGAMFAVFTSFACAIATVIMGFLIYKKVDTIFNKHLFNGLPVIVMLVTANSVIAWIALTAFAHSIVGLAGFALAMTATIVAAVLTAVPLIAMCASRASANKKVSALLTTIIALLILLLAINS